MLEQFIDEKPYKVVANFDAMPGYVCWVAQGQELYAHDFLAPIIGDIIHNLRDALDLAFIVLIRGKQGAKKNAAFPTCDALASFQLKIDNQAQKQGWPQNLATILKLQLQPYTGGHGHLLRALYKSRSWINTG